MLTRARRLKMTRTKQDAFRWGRQKEKWERRQSTARKINKQPGAQMQRRHMTPNIDMQITSNESSTERKRERERVQGSIWDLLASCTWKNRSRQEEQGGQEEDIWYYNRSTFPTLCPFAGSNTPQYSTQGTTPERWPRDYLDSQEPDSSGGNGTGHWHGYLRIVARYGFDWG